MMPRIANTMTSSARVKPRIRLQTTDVCMGRFYYTGEAKRENPCRWPHRCRAQSLLNVMSDEKLEETSGEGSGDGDGSGEGAAGAGS